MGEQEERFGTKVVRSGRALPAGAGAPVVPPLVQSVAFAYGSMAEQDAVFGNERAGYVYGRYGTPTTAALEGALAELEGTTAATCFVSGMAAIHAVVTALSAETVTAPSVRRCRRIVAQEDCYGQVRALLERMRREQGLDVEFVDPLDLAAVDRALAREGGALLCVEAISNPLLRVADIAALAERVHARGGKLMVDATIASPALFTPARLGVDVVVHSLTKYINGHGDVMGGVACGSTELAAELRDRAILDGAYLPPHEAWLILRGLRTLELRIRRQCDSALAIAHHLAQHPKVRTVHYPGLPHHPQHALAERQFGGRYGGVVSFVIAPDERAAAFRFLDALRLAASATTMGDLYTEVLYPPTSSHRRIPPEERARLGISDGFMRLSVGIEDPADIIADLDAALAHL